MSEITLALEHPSLGCGEIIARYDLSKIQEKAYEQGRADMLMPYDVESIEELIVNVRAKVIEEVHRKYTELNERDFAKWLGEEWFKAD